jgi:hypothetical protein
MLGFCMDGRDIEELILFDGLLAEEELRLKEEMIYDRLWKEGILK